MGDVTSKRQLEYLAAGGAVSSFAVFALFATLLFETQLWGVVSGVLVGVGIYLFLPGLTLLSMPEDSTDAPMESTVTTIPGMALGPHRTAAGLALATGGVVTLSVGFAFPDDVLLGVLVAALVAAAGYLPLAKMLPVE